MPPHIGILANMLAMLSDVGDIGEDVHRYIPINEADLAPIKRHALGRHDPSSSKTGTLAATAHKNVVILKKKGPKDPHGPVQGSVACRSKSHGAFCSPLSGSFVIIAKQ